MSVELEANAKLNEKIPQGFRGFIYLLAGKLQVNTENVNQREAYFFENIDELNIEALIESHFMLCMGQPHGEPIRQYGPFVD